MLINGDVVEDSDRRQAVHNWLEEMGGMEVRAFASIPCPYCGLPMRGTHRVSWKEDVFDEEAMVRCCDNCAYWFYSGLKNIGASAFGCPCATEMKGYISKLAEFETRLPQECSAEFAQHLRRNPSLWHSMAPRTLELLVAEVFKHSSRVSEVFHVGRPADGGVDVLFVDSGRAQWLVQVKRRESPSASEGVSTIRNLLGAAVLHQAIRGVVVSTADHYTYQAYRARSRAEEVGYTLDLIDRGKLNRMLNPLLPDRPWLRFIGEEHPRWRGYFEAEIPSRLQLRLF
jgi:hypothetical protein